MEEYEKLIIANAYIRQLKLNINELSEHNKSLQLTLLKAEKEIRDLLGWKKGEIKELKKNEHVSKLNAVIAEQKKDITRLRKDNTDLIIRLNQK